MTSSSSSPPPGGPTGGPPAGEPPVAASAGAPREKIEQTRGQQDASAGAAKPSAAPGDARTAARTTNPLQNAPSVAPKWDPTAPPAPQATIPCPKCGAAVREVARFCQRCHMTMRFECPSCGNKQRTGVKCEKCGINFVKYIGAVVAAKKPEEDTIEAKIDRRSAFLKNVFAIPFTGGLSLFKKLGRAGKRNS